MGNFLNLSAPVAAVLLLASCQTCCDAAAPMASWLDAATKIEPWIIERQEALHKIPELLYDTPKTYSALDNYLTELGVKHWRPKSGTGIIAEIGTGKAPFVALRSDIDALPITELGAARVKSEHEGKAHMCGHDGHMAMLLGGARLLQESASTLQGTVRLLFQPAEEGGAGADAMVKEGAVKDVSAAFGFHVMPHIPSGTVASRAGAIMAGAHLLHITVTGRGGHAAMPHTTHDPVVAASAIVLALQSLVSRETDPLGSSVISVTTISGGRVFNVIPDSVELGGTVRALSDEWMGVLKRRIKEVATHQAASYGCTAVVDWKEDIHPYYPPTVNDKGTHEFATGVASRLLGENRVDSNVLPILPGEDISFIARAVPTTFMFLGIRNETAGSVHGLHNAKFVLDQAALKLGAALHAALASEFLAGEAGKQGGAGGAGGEL